MELKLRSIWLLLSCSLQQSLVGILASVPQTNAKKCTERVSNDGERSTVRKVQMIRRIPARCSGWDEAWSWITKIDCRTKYVLDYIELPFDVKKTDEDCDPAEAEASESGDFNVTDERFLAIVFGSAAVAVLILIIILVILVKRGRPWCGNLCGRSSDYTATATDNEVHVDQHPCNEYVDEGLKLVEPEYEEIRDPNAKEKLLNYPQELMTDTELKALRYQNVPDPVSAHEASVMNGLFSRTVIPSAPYEEEIHQQTAVKDTDLLNVTDSGSVSGSLEEHGAVKCMMSESVSETNMKVESAQIQTKVKEIDELKSADQEKSKDDSDDKEKDKNEKSEQTRPKTENLYSEFDNIVNSNRTDVNCTSNGAIKAHSYENLDQDFSTAETVTPNYESLALGDVNCSVEKCLDTELECKELDSNVVVMQNLKEISPFDSPIQNEDTC